MNEQGNACRRATSGVMLAICALAGSVEVQATPITATVTLEILSPPLGRASEDG